MAKRNSVEIVLSARDQATKEIEQAVKKTTREFSSLNRSLKGIGLNSQEINKINTHIKEVNPSILEKEMKNVRNQLHGLGLSASEIEKITNELNETTKTTKKVDTEVKKMSDHAKHNMKKVEHATHKAHGGFMDMYKGALMMSAVMASVAATMAPFIAAVNGIKFNASIEQAQIAWEGLLKSQQKAVDTMSMLQDLGAKTPFEFEGLDKVARQLEMAGLGGEDLEKRLTALGDAVAYAGKGQEELEGVGIALTQIATKGKISAEEMAQLGERGIDGWGILANALGKTKREVMDLSSEGKLVAEDVLPLMFEQMEKSFGGSMQKQSQTFNGLLSTAKDILKMISGELTKGAFQKLKSSLSTVIPIMQKFLDGLRKGGIKGALKEVLPPSVASFLITSFESIGIAFNKVKEIFIENKSAITEVVTVIKDSIIGFITTYVDTVKKLFTGEGNLGQSFVNIFNNIKSVALPILQDAFSFIKSTLADLKLFWDANGAQIIEAFKNVWSIIASVIDFVMPYIKIVIENAWGAIKAIIKGAIGVILGLIKIFAGLFTGDWKKLWEGVKDIFKSLARTIWDLIKSSFLGDIYNVIVNLKDKAVAKFNELKDKAIEKFKSLKDRALAPITELKDKVATKFQEIKSKIVSPIQEAKDKVESFIGKIKGFFTNLKLKIPKPSLPKLPHFSLTTSSKKVLGKTITYPTGFDVEWYDKGGVFYGPQIIGVGEKRPEFVGALDDLRKIIKEETGGSNKTINVTVNGSNIDIDENRLVNILQRVEVLYG